MRHGNSFTDDHLIEFYESYKKWGGNREQVCHEMDLSQTGFFRRKKALQAMLDEQKEKPVEAPADPKDERREKKDAGFWQKRSRELEAELAKLEHYTDEIVRLKDTDIDPPSYEFEPSSTGDKKKAVLGLLISDAHIGEVVKADEILGLNHYDVATARARLRRYFQAAVEIGPRWAADRDLKGCIVFANGDGISGDIHLELLVHNELSSHGQFRVYIEEMIAGLLKLADAFGLVHFVQVPGNHGRTTQKPFLSGYADTNYDTLAGHMIRDRLLHDPRFTFNISPSRDAITQVCGHGFFLTHGDGLGTGGGKGFIGAIAPISRGASLLDRQQYKIKRPYDYLLSGHFHYTCQPSIKHFASGSLPGYTPMGNSMRACIEPANQWLFLIEERWGVRERTPIILSDDPPPAQLPFIHEAFR